MRGFYLRRATRAIKSLSSAIAACNLYEMTKTDGNNGRIGRAFACFRYCLIPRRIILLYININMSNVKRRFCGCAFDAIKFRMTLCGFCRRCAFVKTWWFSIWDFAETYFIIMDIDRENLIITFDQILNVLVTVLIPILAELRSQRILCGVEVV